MGPRTDLLDLGRLGLSSGEGRRLDLSVPVEPIAFAGERYEVADGEVAVVLDASHTTTGWALRLRYEAELRGPCMRCLEPAAHAVPVDAREVDQPGGGDELRSPYLTGDELDLRGWARDALVLALPAQVLCRADCRGLCAVCGENLNSAAPDHGHEPAPDPRWERLRELKLE